MLTRQQLVRAALRSYPAAVRDERGAEMETTILDAGPTPRRTVARELLHLTRFGLNARARGVASAGTGRVIADGVCRGATWIMILDLSTLSVWRLTELGHRNPLAVVWSTILLAAVLAIALYGYDRVAGIGGLTWVAVRAPQLASATTLDQWLPPAVLLAGCFATLVLYPRERAADWRRLGWLLVPLWLIATFVSAGRNSGTVFIELLAVVAAVVAAAVVTLPTDPRLAIAAALPVTYMGLGFAYRGGLPGAVFVASAPVVVGVAVLRSRRLRLPTDRPAGGRPAG